MDKPAFDIGQYMEDGKGRLVPIECVKEIEKTEDSLVKHLVKKGQELHDQMMEFKAKCMAEVMAFVDLSAMEYDVKMGGTKGNLTLHSFDMRYKVVVQVQDRFVFGEQLQIAKVMIDECLRKWTEGTRTEIQAIINDAFQVDKEGKINTKRILELRRLDIKDALWRKAMDAISESLMIADSKKLFRLYRKDPATLRWDPIALDMAAI